MTAKTILLTGGAGFIGSNFAPLLVTKGHDVVVLDALTYAGHRENLDGLTEQGRFEFIEGDIRDESLVAGLFQKFEFDAVLNFAAESHVDRSITGPKAFIETNVLGTFSLLRNSHAYWERLKGVEKEQFRFLQVSTDEVYGSLGPEGKFSETTSYAPNSPYSASKASGDMLVRAWYHTYGLPTIVTNCSNNYGPRQYPEKLIPFMILCALQGKPLPVYGDGLNVRDWIHVEDHCSGVLLALEHGKPGATYCFGGNSERTNSEVVAEICRQLNQLHPRADGIGYESTIEFVKDRPGHDRRYAIDDSLAQRELGFSRSYKDFEAGLAQTVRWYLENDAWIDSVLGKKA